MKSRTFVFGCLLAFISLAIMLNPAPSSAQEPPGPRGEPRMEPGPGGEPPDEAMGPEGPGDPERMRGGRRQKLRDRLMEKLQNLDEKTRDMFLKHKIQCENYSMLAEIAYKDKKFDDAIKYYREILNLSPPTVDPVFSNEITEIKTKFFLDLVKVAIEAGKAESIKSELEDFMKKSNVDDLRKANVYTQVGRVLKNQGKSEAAVECIQKALELSKTAEIKEKK